jgi:hypothetical protein
MEINFSPCELANRITSSRGTQNYYIGEFLHSKHTQNDDIGEFLIQYHKKSSSCREVSNLQVVSVKMMVYK